MRKKFPDSTCLSASAHGCFDFVVLTVLLQQWHIRMMNLMRQEENKQ